MLLMVVLAMAALAVAGSGRLFGSGPATGGVSDDSTSTALATVTHGPLTSQTNVSGTIAYTSTYTVINEASGMITTLPQVGQIIEQGQILYEVGGSPVVLLHGSTPVHRDLQEGMSGPDVAELNADLVALGLATPTQIDPASDYFSGATAGAVERLQANLGLVQTGILSLGQAVFLPTAARITTVSAILGASAQPGQTVLQATSTTRLVIVQLDAALQAGVQVGDRAIITLPNSQTTPGTVSDVGTVATSTGNGSGSSNGSGETATVEVDISLDDPSATGNLDQAPVQVAITTGRVDDALIVPVDALLALAGGGYAVETVDARGIHHLEPVSLGLFDDADGLVQVSGAGLSAGQHVVVPST
jgi:peptidoglycan hydrolase-like protein with peptidoglycan-binding domain